MKHKRIIIGGGGTGGHIFPAISIAGAIKEMAPDAEILFVGAENKIEMEKVPEAGYRIIGLPVAGLQRKLTLKNLSFPFKLMRSMRRSAGIINSFRPDVAVGVGGYASGPILRAAASRDIPVVIQEQNSYAGLTNKLLAKKAQKIFVAYDGMDKYFPAEKIVFTGNPIRKDIIESITSREEALEHFGLQPGRKTILILGGSLGARTINRAIEGSLQKFGEDIQLLWQSGKIYYEAIKQRIEGRGLSGVHLLPFIKEMNMAYAAADIIVSRAGAGTISELAVVGKPVVLVPSPNVAEDHQTKNALALSQKNAAVHVPDARAEEALAEECMKLAGNEAKMNELSINIKKMAIPDAAMRIAKEIMNIK